MAHLVVCRRTFNFLSLGLSCTSSESPPEGAPPPLWQNNTSSYHYFLIRFSIYIWSLFLPTIFRYIKALYLKCKNLGVTKRSVMLQSFSPREERSWPCRKDTAEVSVARRRSCRFWLCALWCRRTVSNRNLLETKRTWRWIILESWGGLKKKKKNTILPSLRSTNTPFSAFSNSENKCHQTRHRATANGHLVKTFL